MKGNMWYWLWKWAEHAERKVLLEAVKMATYIVQW